MDHGAVSRAAGRPQWTACLDHLREGDTLVVCSLDRVAGTEAMAIEIIRDLATGATPPGPVTGVAAGGSGNGGAQVLGT